MRFIEESSSDNFVGHIDVGDECCRRNTAIRCW